ncbi:MaoC family dehydratase N-terminal domain-containing protein [Novosphingobium tardum]|uniref:MaoC family dehydratase N-terminal domain-containing protein n=1 Tax=Novosphingobium tardum TaxID=1538021 RepID=A0ABV8RLU2_9SPHN
MDDWSAWIGREERRTDRVDPALVARWVATLDREPANPDLLPQGLHWCLCTPDAPTAGLGTDGHPRRDESAESFMPPVPLPRRMWASSKVEFHTPMRIGDEVRRTSRIQSVTAKQGGSGHLVFVEVQHDTRSDGSLAVRETQSLVYREAAPAGAPPVPPEPTCDEFDPEPWQSHRSLVPTEPLLFRYSALTFNSHRIHYDLAYATNEEGYRGLVVHGPLTATLLLDLAARELGDNILKTFAFRGVSPAICGEMLHLVLRSNDQGLELGAFAVDGRQVMTASATR